MIQSVAWTRLVCVQWCGTHTCSQTQTVQGSWHTCIIIIDAFACPTFGCVIRLQNVTSSSLLCLLQRITVFLKKAWRKSKVTEQCQEEVVMWDVCLCTCKQLRIEENWKKLQEGTFLNGFPLRLYRPYRQHSNLSLSLSLSKLCVKSCYLLKGKAAFVLLPLLLAMVI